VILVDFQLPCTSLSLRKRDRPAAGQAVVDVTVKTQEQAAPAQFDADCDRVAALLLDAIASEPVPAQITLLARQLQAALDARKAKAMDTVPPLP